MPFSIPTACAQLAWTIATGSVEGYDVSVQQSVVQVPGPSAEVCLTVPNLPHQVWVRAFNAQGQRGPWSDPLDLQWVEMDAFAAPRLVPNL